MICVRAAGWRGPDLHAVRIVSHSSDSYVQSNIETFRESNRYARITVANCKVTERKKKKKKIKKKRKGEKSGSTLGFMS